MSAIAQGALGMTVVGDPTPTSTPYKPTLKLPTTRLVPIRVAMPIVRPVNALPPVYAPTTPATPAPPTPAPAPAPVVAPTPVAIKVASPTVSGGSGLPVTSGMSPPIIASIPSLTEVTSDPTDHTTRNVVLASVGVGVLAYFLFFRRRA